MALYFFDAHDGGEVDIDDVGLEFPNFEAVKKEATCSLAELAFDLIPGSIRRELAVVVRDAQSRLLLRTVIILEVEVLLD
jgi:hypothetical protein